MHFKRFAIGLRFVKTKTSDEMWDLLFSAVPYLDLIGAELSMVRPGDDEVLIEPVEILCISNLSLSRARRLYDRMTRNTVLMSSLALYHPFRQLNYLSACEQTAELGSVDENGVVSGGTARFGGMRFSHRELPPIVEIIPVRFLVAGAPEENGDGAFDVCRKTALEIMEHVPAATAIMAPIDHIGRGVADAFVLAHDGRYQRFAITGDGASIVAGVLPDFGMALDASRIQGAEADSFHMGCAAATAILYGCKKLIVAVDSTFAADRGAGFVRAVRAQVTDPALLSGASFRFLYPDVDACQTTADTLAELPCRMKHEHLLKAVLEGISIGSRMKDYSHIALVLSPKTAADRAAVSDVLEEAKRLLKRAAVVDPASPAEELSSLAGALWK